jgi:glycosyltransferase involved in cell wall biosynthesis
MKTSRLKFAVVGPVSPVRGGIAHHTTELCRQLNKKHSVTAYSLERLYDSFIHRILSTGNSTLDTKSQLTFEKKTTLSTNPISWVRCALQIRKLKPDYLIATWDDPYIFPLFLTIRTFLPRRTKLVFICHESFPYEKRLFTNVLNKAAFKMAHSIVVHSTKDAEKIQKMSPRTKVSKLFLPLFDFFPKDNMKKLPGLQGQVLLFFGYVRKYKGLNYLIDALPTVLKAKPATLLIVGEFWEDKKSYLDQIQKLGLQKNIQLVDRYVPDNEVQEYFSTADVVVAPYVRATQSAAISTAYAFDKPVIATNVGGLPEMVLHGKTGYLVRPGDSDALAKAIIKLKNPAKFNKGIQQIKKDLSWERFCALLIERIK